MKKILSLVLATLMLSMSAFGCSNSSQSSSTASSAASSSAAATGSSSASTGTASAEGGTAVGGMVDTSQFKKSGSGPYKVGFSNISIVNTFRVQMVHELENAAKNKNVTLYTTNANGDDSKQVSDIQDLISRGVDALLVAPGSSTATNAVTKKAIKQGIPVIVFNAEVQGDENYTSFVGTNAEDFGYILGKWLVKTLNGKGKIIVLDGMAGNAITEKREDGLKKAMKELPDGGTNIKILSTYYADWAYDKGKQATEKALAAYSEIDGVWSQGGAMTQGAIEAFQAANRKLVPMTGDDNNGYLKLWKANIKDGYQSFSASEPAWMGSVALDEALDALNGKPIPKIDYLTLGQITSETLDKYVRTDMSDSFWCNTRLPETDIEKYYKSK